MSEPEILPTERQLLAMQAWDALEALDGAFPDEVPLLLALWMNGGQAFWDKEGICSVCGNDNDECGNMDSGPSSAAVGIATEYFENCPQPLDNRAK